MSGTTKKSQEVKKKRTSADFWFKVANASSFESFWWVIRRFGKSATFVKSRLTKCLEKVSPKRHRKTAILVFGG